MAGGDPRPPRHVVVGSGTAGCMLVNRLLAHGHEVTLVERPDGPGGSGHREAARWGEQLYSSSNPHLQRCYSAAQAGLCKRRVYLPLGKGIGGSSNLNATMLTLGSREGFAGWPESIFSAEGLAATMEGPVAAAVRPTAMRSSFNIVRHLLDSDSSSSSSSGDSSFFYEGAATWGYWSSTHDSGDRPNATRADMRSLLAPPGRLRVVRGTVVNVLVERRRAQGVTVLDGRGAPAELRAARGGEVVLCAGVVGSFELLCRLRSREAGAPATYSSQLFDHVALPVVFVGRWWRGGSDSYPSTGVHGWINLPAPGEAAGPPEAQLVFLDGRGAAAHLPALLVPDLAGEGVLLQVYRFAVCAPLRALLALLARTWPVQWLCGLAVVVMVCVVRPKSEGSITVDVSSDGSSAVSVDPGYLTDPRDVATLRRALAAASAIVERRYGWCLWQLLPGPLCFEPYARLMATTYYHMCGSCPLPLGGSGGAVDERLRVRGFEGLRVADASVLPVAPAGPPAALCLCVGAACARFLVEDCESRCGPM